MSKRDGRFIKGHDGMVGKKNPMWKGDNVGYFSLHQWIYAHLKKPKKCQKCGLIKKLDLANISGEYKRDLSDWEWLCRRCHMIKDGRMAKFNELKKGQTNPSYKHGKYSIFNGLIK